VLLVSKPYMERRSFATARRLWSRRRRRIQGKRFAGHEPIIAHEVS